MDFGPFEYPPLNSDELCNEKGGEPRIASPTGQCCGVDLLPLDRSGASLVGRCSAYCRPQSDKGKIFLGGGLAWLRIKTIYLFGILKNTDATNPL